MKATHTKPKDAFASDIPEGNKCDVYVYFTGGFSNLRGSVKRYVCSVAVWDGANHISLSNSTPIKMWEQTIEWGSGDTDVVTVVEVTTRS